MKSEDLKLSLATNGIIVESSSGLSVFNDEDEFAKHMRAYFVSQFKLKAKPKQEEPEETKELSVNHPAHGEMISFGLNVPTKGIAKRLWNKLAQDGNMTRLDCYKYIANLYPVKTKEQLTTAITNAIYRKQLRVVSK